MRCPYLLALKTCVSRKEWDLEDVYSCILSHSQTNHLLSAHLIAYCLLPTDVILKENQEPVCDILQLN